MVSEEKLKKLLAKLQSPLHLDYISEQVLEMNKLQTREILAYLIDERVVVELENKYYKLKTYEN